MQKYEPQPVKQMTCADTQTHKTHKWQIKIATLQRRLVFIESGIFFLAANMFKELIITFYCWLLKPNLGGWLCPAGLGTAPEELD